jgi:hypothetical protein
MFQLLDHTDSLSSAHVIDSLPHDEHASQRRTQRAVRDSLLPPNRDQFGHRNREHLLIR